MSRLFRLASACALCSALLAGCVVYEPWPGYYVTSTSYDRAWSASLGAVRDAGVQVQSEDYSAGLIRGARGDVDVTVAVTRQADGRVRVQFDSRGPTEQDPGLANRFSQAYDRRMGR